LVKILRGRDLDVKFKAKFDLGVINGRVWLVLPTKSKPCRWQHLATSCNLIRAGAPSTVLGRFPSRLPKESRKKMMTDETAEVNDPSRKWRPVAIEMVAVQYGLLFSFHCPCQTCKVVPHSYSIKLVYKSNNLGLWYIYRTL
jgi:hypothetical protein